MLLIGINTILSYSFVYKTGNKKGLFTLYRNKNDPSPDGSFLIRVYTETERFAVYTICKSFCRQCK